MGSVTISSRTGFGGVFRRATVYSVSESPRPTLSERVPRPFSSHWGVQVISVPAVIVSPSSVSAASETVGLAVRRRLPSPTGFSTVYSKVSRWKFRPKSLPSWSWRDRLFRVACRRIFTR